MLPNLTPEMLEGLLALIQRQGPKQLPWDRAPSRDMVHMLPPTNKFRDDGFYREAPDTGFRSNMPIIEMDREEMERRRQAELQDAFRGMDIGSFLEMVRQRGRQ